MRRRGSSYASDFTSYTQSINKVIHNLARTAGSSYACLAAAWREFVCVAGRRAAGVRMRALLPRRGSSYAPLAVHGPPGCYALEQPALDLGDVGRRRQEEETARVRRLIDHEAFVDHAHKVEVSLEGLLEVARTLFREGQACPELSLKHRPRNWRLSSLATALAASPDA